MPKDKPFTKPTKHYCKYVFDNPELLAIGKQLAEHNANLTAVEADKKRVVADFQAKITALEAEIAIASGKIQTGYQWMDMPCTIHYNLPKTGKKQIMRDDTKEIVQTADMTSEEMQMELPVQ